jgi:hypothetical protein
MLENIVVELSKRIIHLKTLSRKKDKLSNYCINGAVQWKKLLFYICQLKFSNLI